MRLPGSGAGTPRKREGINGLEVLLAFSYSFKDTLLLVAIAYRASFVSFKLT